MATQPESPATEAGLPVLTARGVIGGTLMGLANLVPGISGGTMLLAASSTTERVRKRSVVTSAIAPMKPGYTPARSSRSWSTTAG